MVESMDNLLDADYRQKQELLNSPDANYSFQQQLGFNQGEGEFTQSTSLMYKTKGEKPTFLQLKQESAGDNFQLTGVYDSSKFKGKYSFAQQDSATSHSGLFQYKGESTQFSLEASNTNTKPDSEQGVEAQNLTQFSSVVYTNRTQDLNFRNGLYTENRIEGSLFNGNMGRLTVS